MLYGSYFSARDVASGAKVVALSSNAARAIYGRENAVGETLGLINGPPGSKSVPYRVVAITESTRQNSQGPASPLLKPAVLSAYNKAGTLLVRARAGRLSQAKAQLLSAARSLYKNDPQIKSQGGGFYFTPVGNPFDSGSTGVNATLRAFFAIAALTLTVSLLGVLASLLVSVGERTRELGLRRAIGATRGQIVQTLLLEATLTTLLGGLLGVLLAGDYSAPKRAQLDNECHLSSRYLPRIRCCRHILTDDFCSRTNRREFFAVFIVLSSYAGCSAGPGPEHPVRLAARRRGPGRLAGAGGRGAGPVRGPEPAVRAGPGAAGHPHAPHRGAEDAGMNGRSQ